MGVVGLLLALAGFGLQIAVERRAGRATADALTASMEFPASGQPGVVIRNGGAAAIHDVVWWDGVAREHWADSNDTIHGDFWQVIAPGEAVKSFGPFYGPFSEYGAIEIDFVDHRGKRWRKVGPELHRVRNRRYRERYPFMESDPLLPLR